TLVELMQARQVFCPPRFAKLHHLCSCAVWCPLVKETRTATCCGKLHLYLSIVMRLINHRLKLPSIAQGKRTLNLNQCIITNKAIWRCTKPFMLWMNIKTCFFYDVACLTHVVKHCQRLVVISPTGCDVPRKFWLRTVRLTHHCANKIIWLLPWVNAQCGTRAAGC